MLQSYNKFLVYTKKIALFSAIFSHIENDFAICIEEIAVRLEGVMRA